MWIIGKDLVEDAKEKAKECSELEGDMLVGAFILILIGGLFAVVYNLMQPTFESWPVVVEGLILMFGFFAAVGISIILEKMSDHYTRLAETIEQHAKDYARSDAGQKAIQEHLDHVQKVKDARKQLSDLESGKDVFQ